jgi:hypothetical protein
MVRIILLAVSAAVAAGLLFVNLYNSIVDAPNWGANLPGSIDVARQYYATSNPGNFFRIVSPINQVLAVILVVLSWKNNRYLALAFLITAILLDVLTFSYFYPRNEILFEAPLNVEAIRQAWTQWSTMNWFRTLLGVLNTSLVFALLIKNAKSLAK